MSGKSFVLTPFGSLERLESNLADALANSDSAANQQKDKKQNIGAKVNVIITKMTSSVLDRQLSVKREGRKLIAAIKFNTAAHQTKDRSGAVTDHFLNNSYYICDHTEPKQTRMYKCGPHTNTMNINLYEAV